MLLATKVGTLLTLALLLAVAVILVTPDPTDDLEAIVDLGKVVPQTSTLVSALNIAQIVRPSKRLCVVGPSNETSRLLDLLCACRC